MSPFVVDYLIFVFCASLGAIQIGASIGQFGGLLFIRNFWVARILGMVLASGAVAWFFLSDSRNINDIHGGLDANSQSIGFFVGAAAALLCTLCLSSLINLRMHRGDPKVNEGLDALRKTCYLLAIRRTLPAWMDNPFARLIRFYSGDKAGILFGLGSHIISLAKRV